MAMTFGKLGQEEHVLILVTNSKESLESSNFHELKLFHFRWISFDKNSEENS